MIRVEEATPYQQCIRPWVYDRIEVRASVFTGPAKGTHHRADFERPTEELRFSLVGTWHCEFPSGPHLGDFAAYCRGVTGRDGFYGLAGLRRVNP